MVFPDGSILSGLWEADKPHGEAIFSGKDGYIYKGAWVRGKREGKGAAWFKNGACFLGSFSNGLVRFRQFHLLYNGILIMFYSSTSQASSTEGKAMQLRVTKAIFISVASMAKARSVSPMETLIKANLPSERFEIR